MSSACREHAPMASPDGGPMGAGQAAAAAPTGDTEKPMRGTWKLIRPDGRTYHASSPIQCLRAEQTERIPPHVALQRIMEAATSPSDSELSRAADAMDAANANTVAWAVSRWEDEVSQRPLINVHRRSLDGAWRQVIRHHGGDPDKLLGPSHDALMAAEPKRNGRPISWGPEPPDYQDAARRLWMLLDDIDTLDDACRADDAAFRNNTRNAQRKRFAILSGEQMDVLLACAAMEKDKQQ